MGSKGTFIILIVVVAILTLTLAALAGYLFLVQGSPNQNASTNNKAANSQAANVKEVPDEKELTTLELYEGKKYFNLKNDDSSKISIIQANVSLKYYNEIKEDKKIKVEEKIAFYEPEIRELISTYFLGVTLEEVKEQDAKKKAKEVLKKQINELLNEGKSEVHEYVYSVIIDDWLYQ